MPVHVACWTPRWHQRMECGKVQAPISLTAPPPQGQPVPGRAGAPRLHGAPVPEGEEGARAGGGGDSLWGSRRREPALQWGARWIRACPAGVPRAVGYPLPLTSSLCPQKLTWRSNPSDINVCRMKGKQEVSGPWSRPQSAMTTLKLNRGHNQGEILLLLLHPRPATRVVMATP